MRTFFEPAQRLHRGRGEFTDGRFVPCVEVPERADLVLAAVREAGLGPVLEPGDFGTAPIERVHDPRLLRFLEAAHGLWRAEGREDDALPTAWPTRALRADVEPRHVLGRLGYWCFDSGTPVGPGTWAAAYASAQAALAAADALLSAGGWGAAFALCRPPGHHAARDAYGGYCFLNNAAIAAQAAIDRGGAARVAVLDVDYHHGNGTQAIFWERGDVLFVSVHADPAEEYPFFLGHADERGAGAGEGATLNLPLPFGTRAGAYLEALDAGLARVRDFGPDLLVVSLGVDTFAGDPISRFRLQTADFPRVGERIAGVGRPTLFVLEGGYAVEAIGANVVGVLGGFLAAAR